MPLYEFECERCPTTFEELLFAGDDPAAVRCPQCASDRVRRRLSIPAAPVTKGLLVQGGCDASLPPCSPACCRLPGGA